jgi:hypothetical protein
MDQRIAQSSLGDANSSEQSHRLLTFLLSLWIRGRVTNRLDLDITKDWAIRRSRNRTHQKTRARQHRRSRVNATVQFARYLQGLRRHYNKSTQPRSVQVRDLVLRRIQKVDGRHKLLSPWEGPFIVAKVTGLGTYELMTGDGVQVRNSWHISRLRRFYA